MELLKRQMPLIYWLLRTLWEVLVTALMTLLSFLCFALIVYLFNMAKAN